MITARERDTIVQQIGMGNILSISGGRITPLPRGIELPVSNGYYVRVVLDCNDTYTVSRIFKRGGKEFVKGSLSYVYCDQVGSAAYKAGMFQSYGEEWAS